MGMADKAELGWQVARFALDRLVPKAGFELTSVRLWQTYQEWCAKAGSVPIAEAEFHACFAALAHDVGMETRQVGANLSYRDTALKDAADVDDRQAA
jgi:phage/plasmid-associated DNA primase